MCAAKYCFIVVKGYGCCCHGNHRAHMRIPDVTFMIQTKWPALCDKAYIKSANVQVACMESYGLLVLLVLTDVHVKHASA